MPVTYQRTIKDELIFNSMLLRLTGRPEPWSQYHEHSHPGQKPSLVSFSERQQAMRFLNSTCGGTWDDKMTSWMSDQMKDSLPKTAIACPKSFSDFMEVFGNCIVQDNLFDKMSDLAMEQGRNAAVICLSKIIDYAVGQSNNQGEYKSTFIAEQVIRDLEEVINEPFGEVVETNYGWGSTSGSKCIIVDSSGDSKRKKRITKHQICKEVVRYMKEKAGNDLLEVMCYGRDSKGVFDLQNGRYFNLVDAEHFLCKAYLASGYARGTRSYNSHHLARPFCHPTRTKGLHSTIPGQYLPDKP